MYNLTEDFTRQTALRDPAEPVSNNSEVRAMEECLPDKPHMSIAPEAHLVHQLADILRRPIPDEMMNSLCFSETLLVCDGNETVVGGAALNVSLIAEEVLAAFSSTRLTFLGHSTAESELMSFADRNCRPLQERKCETLISGTTRQEKQIQLYFDETHNVTAYRQECNGIHTESFQGLLSAEMCNETDDNPRQTIVPDGLQLLVLRYLMLSNFVGQICSQTIDVLGRVGNCVHTISAVTPMPRNRNVMHCEEIKEVRKTIWYSDDSEPEESVSHYSTSGRLLRHGWNNSSYILIANPLGSAPPSAVIELERSMRDYVHALAGLIKNRASVKGLIDDIDCSVKEMDRSAKIVNPVLIDIINEI